MPLVLELCILVLKLRSKTSFGLLRSLLRTLLHEARLLPISDEAVKREKSKNPGKCFGFIFHSSVHPVGVKRHADIS